MNQQLNLRIGIDTGGTFTDFVATWKGDRIAFKLPSTPRRPEESILAGVERIINQIEVGETKGVAIEIAHGTTVGTNSLLEGKGARTALITTAGFEDVIEIGRQARPDLYNLDVERRPPLVPRNLRFGIRERTALDGSILAEISGVQLRQLRNRIERARVESIAVCLLFSFANPAHEKRLANSLSDLGVNISLSHEILPEYREYERTSTVVINAYLVPRVGRYLSDLERGLNTSRRNGHRPRVRIMQSSGGSISAQQAAREPVRTILSGPAGGVVAALAVGSRAGFDRLITFDMGGTSTDVSLTTGKSITTNEAMLGGLPVAVPVLDIHTVGAGGGSIARVDEGGALRVGPQSAGADPGPACYGSGDQPTVTDANLILGRFGGVGLLSGAMALDIDRSRKALARLGKALTRASNRKFTPEEAALGVVRVANLNMEQALRLVSIERGHDPRRFSLMSFGGAGGLHAVALAEALRISRVIVPVEPGNFSALGVLLADVVKDYSQTLMVKVKGGGSVVPDFERHFLKLERQAHADLRKEGFKKTETTLDRSFTMRYRGQSFELEVPWSREPISEFNRLHFDRYGHSDPLREIEIVTLRLRASGITQKPAIPKARIKSESRAIPSHRASAVSRRKAIQVAVYNRERLSPGEIIESPAIIVEYGSTTWLPPGWRARIDAWRNLVLTP